MLEIGVKAFGVATIDEAIKLRKNGIDSPILVLGQVFRENYSLAIQYDIDVAIFDLADAFSLSEIAKSYQKKAQVHIKIDTGMGRVGFQVDENGAELVKKVFSLEGIKVTGAFTHFASADTIDKAFANEQRERFLSFTDGLIKEGYALPIRHMYNSAATMEMDGYCGELVRCGIMTYGLYPSDEISKDYKLYPAMELKSSVAFVKNAPKDFKVSYGSTYVTEAQMKIATIPVGYGDGYPRYLSNKGEVLIKGTRCKILGRVCMDQFMVDVSHLTDVKIGDEVTLLGTDGNETITMDEVTDNVNRFNYEFCCLINERVPRVYIKNGKILTINS